MKSRAVVNFDARLKDVILAAFGKEKDESGTIREKISKDPVLGMDGQPLTETEFAGIIKGSEIYLKSDISSLIEFYENSDLWEKEAGTS